MRHVSRCPGKRERFPTVEVGADADVLPPDEAPDVHDVVRDVAQRRSVGFGAPDEARVEVDHDDAAVGFQQV